ncbi:MAG: hypothetical protein U9N54_11740 [candidate division Zixibacteria bacterium]|nr:hypothetical protein [candidate division Zixibacteria bacterium]
MSDKQIQAFIESPENINVKLKAHLDKCRKCRAEIEIYKSLMVELVQEDIPDLSEQFAANVMSSIESLPNPEIIQPIDKWKWLNIAASIAFVLLGVITMIYYDGLQVFSSVYSWFNEIENQAVSKLSETSSSVSTMLGVDLSTILFIGMVLVLFGVLDKILSRKKISSLKIFSI